MSDSRVSPVPGELAYMEPVQFGVGDIRRLFSAIVPGVDRTASLEIRNPHLETPVATTTKQSAKPSSVLILMTDELQPRVLLTKRQTGIRFAGHMCFPGGRAEGNETVVETALRESHEEIGLPPSQVEVLGSFGHYYTQAGFRIDPVIGVVAPDQNYAPDQREVASLHWIPLQQMFEPASYQLKSWNQARGYFGFEAPEFHIGGPTVSLMIGFYEWLASKVRT